MAVASARFFSIFPLLHSRSSSLHVLRRLTTRHCPHLILSPPVYPSPLLSPLRSSHQSSLHSQPLKWDETATPFQEPHGVSGSSRASHPWPEWLQFVNWVSRSGYCNGSFDVGEFVQELNHDFLSIANGCLNFAQNHPNLLWSLPREDIEVVVESGSPCLFEDALSTTRRMKPFLGGGLNDVLESEKPTTVDLMRFLLSYVHMAVVSSENKPINCRVESSVRKLFGELVNSRGIYAGANASAQNQFPERHGQVPRFPGKNIEMKRGDWICPRCSFMNFAKNLKCRECEEPRPQRYLTGGEWECPQCTFFNFSRNAVCLRCNCKKPGQNPSQSLAPVLGTGAQNSSDKGNMEMRSAGTAEKQQQWFSKITQLEKTSDVGGSVEDGSFLKTMQSRDNAFAVGTRNLGIDGNADGIDPQTGLTINTEISEYLDEVLDQTSTSDMSNVSVSSSGNEHPNHAKSASDTYSPVADQLNDKSDSQIGSAVREQESERWFKKVSELYDVKDPGNTISNEDFPEIMPMHKGENHFVVSKKKGRSLTSPMYKRRIAMEQQVGSNKYVPFVPFPPGYFAREKSQESVSEVSSADNSDTTSASNQQSGAVSSNSGTEDKATNPFDNSSNDVEQTQKSSNFSSRSRGTGASNSRIDSSGLSESQSIWRGRSLEGSAVKDPDPLDMSEEAKAERWFRRVAQIKDISELSQIPDEDFPSIMPMRKGVNRFVVSKRKTPLERRLTSAQYRGNLPAVNSDPAKKEADTN